MKQIVKIIFLLSSMSLLCACASSETAKNKSDSFSLGTANQSNIAAQSVEPDPALKANTYIPADRDRVRAAREAYRNGEVKELNPIQSNLD